MPLEPLDLHGERRLRDAEPPRSLAQRPGVGGLEKRAQQCAVHAGSRGLVNRVKYRHRELQETADLRGSARTRPRILLRSGDGRRNEAQTRGWLINSPWPRDTYPTSRVC